jgi:hypothetical protein
MGEFVPRQREVGVGLKSSKFKVQGSRFKVIYIPGTWNIDPGTSGFMNFYNYII